MRDVLSEILKTLELESSLYFRAVFSRPFSVEVPEEKSVIRFHIVSKGDCVIQVDDDNHVAASQGDLVLIPHGSKHVLADDEEKSATSLADVIDISGFTGAESLTYGGGGEISELVCGHFSFNYQSLHPFLTTLPPILVMGKRDGLSFGWVEQALAFAEAETRERREGWHAIVEQLSQILLVCVLRVYAERTEQAGVALSVMAVPPLARAVRAIHETPAHGWTLDELAGISNMSRTAFVRRFREACGISPMQYVTLWRMQRARFLLKQPEQTAIGVSAEVGYASEAHFNRTFKQHFGVTPSSYRRNARAPD